MAHSPTDIKIVQFFRKSFRVSIFSLLQQPPSRSPISQCLVNFCKNYQKYKNETDEDDEDIIENKEDLTDGAHN